jgi:hypothetical protein
MTTCYRIEVLPKAGGDPEIEVKNHVGPLPKKGDIRDVVLSRGTVKAEITDVPIGPDPSQGRSDVVVRIRAKEIWR